MGQFDNILKLNIGGNSFQLADFSLKSKPVVEQGKGRTGTQTQLEGWGWVEAGADLSLLGAAVGAAVGSFNVSKQNIVVTEWSGALVVSLLAAGCLDGGPHISFSLEPGMPESPGTKKFTFVAEANQKADSSSGNPDNSYTVTTATNPDQTRQIQIRGDLTGVGSGAFFKGEVLPQFIAAYPSEKWVVKTSFQINATDDTGSYTITFDELTDPLPTAANFRVVDGEMTYRLERDEQQNVLIHTTWDALVEGDPMAAITAIRPQADSILKESYEFTSKKGQRLKAEFIQLQSGSGDDMLDFEQTFSVNPNYPTYQAALYPGLDPVFVRDPNPPYRYMQRGRAVGLNRFPKEPQPLLPFLSGPPSIERRHVDGFRKETTWSYEFFSNDPATTDLYTLGRPAKPTFYPKAQKN